MAGDALAQIPPFPMRFHQIRNVKMVKYKKIWAWILKDPEPYDMPFDYSHKQGAVIFVTVRSHMGLAS